MRFIRLFEDARIAQVIRALIKDFQRTGECKTPRDINSGYCDLFAERLEQELRRIGIPDFELHQEEPEDEGDEGINHDWVEVNGLHYDAECPAGVPDHLDLPCFRRYFRRTK